MCKLCVFAGTTEGRELVSFLADQPLTVTACVATEYGETLLEPAQNLTIRAERLTQEEMTAFFREEGFRLVLDATHPYAKVVTENISAACQEAGVPYLRVLREDSELGDAVTVPDIAGAVAYLNNTQGNILLTTGSKELHLFTGLRDFGERVYARVLPMDSSLTACREAGLKSARILAMQGPFTEEMNTAMLRFTGAKYLVTKDGGTAGGFAEKAASAKAAGAQLVVIGRPPQKEGVCLAEAMALLCQDYGCRHQPEVVIVGIGPGSENCRTLEAQRAIQNADCVIGARRMVETAGMGKPCFDAIAPGAIAQVIHSHREFRRFAVLMSGDTGFFSGTKKLLPLLTDCRTRVLPGISSLSCLCARLGTSYEDVKLVSLHGRDGNILGEVRREKRVFALVGGEDGIRALCTQLTAGGLGAVRVSVGERLGYPEEKITVGTARELQDGSFAPLSVALIENDTPDAVVTHGLPDELFQRKQEAGAVVPMTKGEVRSICLSKLALTQDAVCWDIGAGTGSVAIEMALQCRRGQVYAIERKQDALELLQENKEKFGVSNMTIVGGLAPEACADLPAPTHVFIGGSAGNMKEILETVFSKNPRARVVATAIALETVAELTGCMPGAEVVSVQAARSKKAGPYRLMMGNNPVFIFTMQGGTK